MSKVCVFFAPGFEEIEGLTVVDILRRAKVDVSSVSITDEKTVTGSHGIPVIMDKLFSEVDFASIDMIVLPGGLPGTTNLEAFAPLMEQVDRFYAEGKYIAAICAAPSIFGHKGFLKGKDACSNPNFESHLDGANVLQKKAVVSDHIITSRGMGTAIEFGLTILECLEGPELTAKTAKGVVYER